ncbi:MAG: trypsin-like peptidase domain-containing protein [Clostridia bacterium]|nr:trypsin-like peptidase domain-containing protein [Clostridia bacterium]
MDNNNNSFKAVKTEKNSYSIPKGKVGFMRGFFVPFVAGALGSLILIGTCLTIPSIKDTVLDKLFENITNESDESNESTNNSLNIEQILSTSSGKSISIEDYSKTSVAVANKVLPSVVGIKVTYSVNSPYYSYYGMSGSTATATGSGVVITDDGYILTNNHVVSSSSNSAYYQVSKATKITVTLYNDSTEYEATIVGSDEQTDLAVLKIEKTGLTAAELGNSDNVQVGEFAMAIGNPLSMESTVTTGIISAKDRKITSDNVTYKVIQTDAAINSGNSGGALINAEGKVIGINTLKLSGSGIEGIGFAIPINDTISVYQQLITNGKVARPYIGMAGRDINETTAKQNNLPREGIYVVSVEEFSAAEKAGIQPGDLIISFDGEEVKTMDKLNELKNKHKIGDEVKIKLIRNGEEKEISLTLGENKPANQQ